MRYYTPLVAFLCLFVSFFANAQQEQHVQGEIILMMHGNYSPEKVVESFQDIKSVPTELKLVKELSKRSKIYLLEFDENAIDEEKLLVMIQRAQGVRAAQFNHIVEDRATPNDPQFGSQWHHIDPQDNDIDTDLAWDITTGGTTVNGDGRVSRRPPSPRITCSAWAP
ncbi:MAG: hypothetical protein AAF193_08965, partial [Bacteroidota bacterium]